MHYQVEQDARGGHPLLALGAPADTPATSLGPWRRIAVDHLTI
jgi:hypothetical protein